MHGLPHGAKPFRLILTLDNVLIIPPLPSRSVYISRDNTLRLLHHFISALIALFFRLSPLFIRIRTRFPKSYRPFATVAFRSRSTFQPVTHPTWLIMPRPCNPSPKWQIIAACLGSEGGLATTPRASGPPTISWNPFRISPPWTGHFPWSCICPFNPRNFSKEQIVPGFKYCKEAPAYLDIYFDMNEVSPHSLASSMSQPQQRANWAGKKILSSLETVTVEVHNHESAYTWRKSGNDLCVPKRPEPRACKQSVNKASTWRDGI